MYILNVTLKNQSSTSKETNTHRTCLTIPKSKKEFLYRMKKTVSLENPAHLATDREKMRLILRKCYELLCTQSSRKLIQKHY